MPERRQSHNFDKQKNTQPNFDIIYYIIEGNLEIKLPTIWTDEKQRWEEAEKRREEERRSKRESLRRKKIQVREKVGKSRNTVLFQWLRRVAKAAGAEPAGQMRDEKLHAVVARSTFPSQNVQTSQVRSTFARRFGTKHKSLKN